MERTGANVIMITSNPLFTLNGGMVALERFTPPSLFATPDIGTTILRCTAISTLDFR